MFKKRGQRNIIAQTDTEWILSCGHHTKRKKVYPSLAPRIYVICMTCIAEDNYQTKGKI